MMIKNLKKPRRMAIIAFMLIICLVMGAVSSFGVAQRVGDAVDDNKQAIGEFDTYYGDTAGWNEKQGAIEIGEDFAYGIIPTRSTSSSITKKADLEYKGSSFPDMLINPDDYFCFNVSKIREDEGTIPDITVTYKGYQIYDDDDPFANADGYVSLEVDATIKSATIKKRDASSINYSLVALGKELSGGFPRVTINNVGELVVKYDYYKVKGGTRESYELMSNMTYTDIDAAQGLAFKGYGLESLEKAVTPTSVMMYGASADNWHIFNAPMGAVMGDPDNAFGIVYKAASGSGRATYISNQIEDGSPAYGDPNGMHAFFGPSVYNWFMPEWAAPRKTVSDADEIRVSVNTVPDFDSASWEYDISQEIPNGLQSAFYPTQFELRDTLDTCLKIDNVTVLDRDGTDISNWFNITTNNTTNEVVATAKAAALASADFYGGIDGNTIRLHIEVTLDKAKSDASDHNHMDGEVWMGKNGVQAGNNPTPALRYMINAKGEEDTDYTNEVTSYVSKDAVPSIPDTEPVPPATKRVEDADESTEVENMLDAPDEKFSYSIIHRLPQIYAPIDEETGEEGDMPYFNAYEFTDTLEDILRPISAKVMSGGTDVSSDFNIRINGQTVTASMTGAALKTDDSYGRQYTLQIDTEIRIDEYYTPAHLAPWLTADGVTLRIPNDAFVAAVDGDGVSNDRPTNEVITVVELPTIETGEPGIEVHKSVEPYEFQIGDEIPYKITFKQNNPDAKAMDVVVTDDTLPKGLNVKEGSIKVTGINRNYTAVQVTGGIQFKTWYLQYGEEVTIDFIAIAEKNLNGKVIPNTVTAEAWGVPDRQDSTTIYLNSPKIDVDKKVSKQGEASVNNTINYEVTIRQTNPGCFMRQIWFEDEILTEGVELDKGSFSVSDTDGNLLALNTDYTLNVQDNKFIMQFAKNNMGYYDKEAGTGGGDGKYPVDSPYIPTWDDARGQAAQYFFKRAADATTTDYEDLDLQFEYIITYTATVDDSALAGKEVENHAVVPTTENTNGDLIKDDPNIPSGGGEDEVTVLIDGPNLIPDKEADKREYNVDEMAEYTLTVGLDGADMTAEDVVITDRFQQTGIAILSSDTIRVRFNNTDITWQCRITPDDDLQGFTIETGRDLTQKDRITVEYLAEIVGDGVLDNTMSAEATNAPKVEWDNDIIVTPMPELKLAKTSDKDVYTIGETGTYKLKVNQIVPGAVAKKIVIDDSITEEGVLIDQESFKVMLNDDDITDKCIIKAEDRSFKIETRRNMTSTDEIVVTYDVLFTDDALPGKVYNVAYAVSDNTPEAEAEHEVELKEVPPELDIVKTSDKKIYVLGEIAEYTVTATQTKEHAVARSVVLKDGFTYGGMQIVPDSIKVMKGDVDITKECTIDTAKRSFKIDTKNDLKYNESITVTYLVQFNSIKLTDAQIGIPQPEQDTTTGSETDVITGPDGNILAGPEVELVDDADGYAHNIVTVDAENAPEEETEHIVSLREPELKIIKKAEKRRYDVGDTGTYTLTVKQKVRHGIATDVVIKDKFKKKGMEIKLSDIKVKKGKKDITKICKITMNGKNGYTIRTGQDLAYGEEMTVTYKVLFKDEALKGKKLRNVAIAKAKNADEVETDEEVKIWGIGFIRLIDPDGNGPGGGSRSGGSSGSGPATGDDSGMLIALCSLLMIISAGGIGSFWRRRFLEGREK